MAGVTLEATQIGRIDEGGPGRVELGDEGVGEAASIRVLNETARRAGEVCRVGGPGHIGVAGGVHGDPVAVVLFAAAQIGRIHEGGPGRVELGDEGVGEAASIRVLNETARRAGEVCRVGEPGHIGVAGGVHGDPVAGVLVAATQIGGPGQHGIDDERLARVVSGELKRDVRG